MVDFRKWNYIFLIGVFGLAIFVVTANLIIDPFNVFHTPFLKRQFQQNQRFNKIQYLETLPKKFGTFMFGSSRIGTTPPHIIEQYLADARAYNMTVSSGTLFDTLKFLEFFLNRGIEIKTAYVQIDIDILLTEYTYPSSDLFRRHHPDVIGGSMAEFYYDYLRSVPLQNLRGKLVGNFRPDRDYVQLELTAGGHWLWPARDKEIEVDEKAYFVSEGSFRRSVTRSIRAIRLDENMLALKSIVLLCRKQGIRLIAFTNPDHRQTLDSYVVEHYSDALRRLAQVTDFWNFSSYNDVTVDDRNYYEVGHYRTHVGRLVAARIFGDRTVAVPRDFGFYVTQSNVEDHLQFLLGSFQTHAKSTAN